MQDGFYRSKLAARWMELRENELKTENVFAYIDSVYSVLNEESQQRNFQRWPVLGQYVWPNYYVGNTYVEEVNWLKSWINNRLQWLDANMPNVITGNDEGIQDVRVAAFPNPFRDEINFSYTLSLPGNFSAELFDVMGKVVATKSESHEQAGAYHMTMATEHLSSGIYFFKVHYGLHHVVVGRLVR